MDPAIGAIDIAKAGAILADMVESFLAAGTTPQLPEGADHDDDVKDRRPAPVAGGVHLHSPVDTGTSPIQPGEHGAPVQSQEQGAVARAGVRRRSESSTAISGTRVRTRPTARTSRRWSAMWRWAKWERSSLWRPRAWRDPTRTGIVCWSCVPSPARWCLDLLHALFGRACAHIPLAIPPIGIVRSERVAEDEGM